MGIKSFLARAEAKGRSLVPLERRLKAADAKFDQSTTRLVRVKGDIATQERIVGDASNALELSVRNEADAENRITRAGGEREKAAGSSDLKSAEKLSARSRKTIQAAERKLKTLNTDLKATRTRQSDRAVESARLATQLKAQKAAGPTRLERTSMRVGQTKKRISAARAKRSSTPKAKVVKKKAKPKAKRRPVAAASRSTPATRIKISGSGPVVRKLKLKKGETFAVPAGRVFPAKARKNKFN